MGESQFSYKPSYGPSNRLVWNMPIEALYRSINPYGWPQLVLTCCGKDYLGRENNYAYGCTTVPVVPERHEKYVRMFGFIPDSLFKRFMSWFTGNFADYIDSPKILASAEGRGVTKVKAEGLIKVVFQVTIRNLDKYGYY